VTWTLPSPLEAAILALAVHYCFYLVSEAALTEKPRNWILTRLDSDEAEDFVECPWCVGMWLGLAATGAWILFGDYAALAALPLALAAVNGLLHRTA
jgi:hypothetical protein